MQLSNSNVFKAFVVPEHTLIWLHSEESAKHRSLGLMLLSPILAETSLEGEMHSLLEGQWKVEQRKYLLEPSKHQKYDGTIWHGVYKRMNIPSQLQTLSLDLLDALPMTVRLAFITL